MSRGFMLAFPGHVQLVLYLWGISLYVGCWRWWPTVQVGQMEGIRWFGYRRIGPDYIQLWGPWLYICAYKPRRELP